MRAKLYTATGCDWCIKAMHALTEAGFITDVVLLTNNSEALSFMAEQGLRTVPQVYIDGTHVGGYEDTVEFLKKLSAKRIELAVDNTNERIGTTE